MVQFSQSIGGAMTTREDIERTYNADLDSADNVYDEAMSSARKTFEEAAHLICEVYGQAMDLAVKTRDEAIAALGQQ
jgi:hypothetical protein